MGKNFIAALTLVLSAFVALSHAQTTPHQCGMSHETTQEIINRLKANKALINEGIIQLRNNTVYVPIKFHLVGKDDGSRRVNESNVLDMLCATNTDFADQNIQFYIKGDFNYIDNDAVFDNHQQTQRGIMTFSKDNQALNVFLLERVSQNPFVGGYYTSLYDWIVIRNSDVNSSYVLTHEIGHFFSLPHPFQGWDAEGFQPTEAGQMAPVTSPGGIPSEKADGSNCEDAGDFICDTPADYNAFGSSCNPSFSVLDPDSIEIQPDRTLFMSYFQCEARNAYHFSEMQKELIAADLASGGRRALVNANPSTTDTVFDEAVNIFPADQSIVNISNGVRFEWTAVENANRYFVEIDRAPNFSGGDSYISFISNETSAVVEGLDNDANYFWRVLPFNEYYTCQPSGDRTVFRTTLETVTSSQELKAVEELSIYPNPVNDDDEVRLFVKAKERITGQLKIHNNTGQEVFTLTNQQLLPGENTIVINSGQFNTGVFSLTFYSEEGSISEKLIVVK